MCYYSITIEYIGPMRFIVLTLFDQLYQPCHLNTPISHCFKHQSRIYTGRELLCTRQSADTVLITKLSLSSPSSLSIVIFDNLFITASHDLGNQTGDGGVYSAKDQRFGRFRYSTWTYYLENKCTWLREPNVITSLSITMTSYGCYGISDHRQFNPLLRLTSKKTSKLRVTGLNEWIHWWPVDSPHKRPVTRNTFPCQAVFMLCTSTLRLIKIQHYHKSLPLV